MENSSHFDLEVSSLIYAVSLLRDPFIICKFKIFEIRHNICRLEIPSDISSRYKVQD